MTVCIDTNVLMQMFGRRARWVALRDALFLGRLSWAVSTEIVHEYAEVITERMGEARWRQIESFLTFLTEVRRTLAAVEPRFRFRVITADPDDNKFTDCAITAGADYVITEDGHFAPLRDAGYKPRPIEPDDFMQQYPEFCATL